MSKLKASNTLLEQYPLAKADALLFLDWAKLCVEDGLEDGGVVVIKHVRGKVELTCHIQACSSPESSEYFKLDIPFKMIEDIDIPTA